MTDREAPPEGDLSEWLIDQRGDTAVDDWAAWDESGGWDEWADRDGHPAAAATQPADPPFYRRPGLILALILIAAAAMVVALALLIAGDGPGRTPDKPLPSRLSPPPTAQPSPSVTPGAGPPPAVEVQPEPPPTEPAESGPLPPEMPFEPAPAPAAPAAPAGADRGTQNSPGPRINVTRTPMSFTPGSAGN